MPFLPALEERPVLNLSAPMKLALTRKLGETGRLDDGRKESATWMLKPGEPAAFFAGSFVPGVLGRLTMSASESERSVFMGRSTESPMPLPLRGSFVQEALSHLGNQAVGETQERAPWTVKWLVGKTTVSVAFAKSTTTGDVRGHRVWAGSTEWTVEPRKGLPQDESARIGSAKATGWTFLDTKSGVLVGWLLNWKVDLKRGLGRLELVDELVCEPADPSG